MQGSEAWADFWRRKRARVIDDEFAVGKAVSPEMAVRWNFARDIPTVGSANDTPEAIRDNRVNGALEWAEGIAWLVGVTVLVGAAFLRKGRRGKW